MPSPDLKTIISDRVTHIKGLERTGEIQEAGIFRTHPRSSFLWMGVSYFPGKRYYNDRMGNFRGYVMVEPPDLPTALDILHPIGQQRREQGQKLDFKWLIGKSNRGQLPQEGVYDDLHPADPRIAIYGLDHKEIQDILHSIASNPLINFLEENRSQAYGGRRYVPRRPGTNAFEHDGKIFRVLNYNDYAGLSEDVVDANPDWRQWAYGDATEILQDSSFGF